MPEFIETTGGSVKGSAASLLAGVSGTALGPCIVGPSPRHQKTGRASSLQLFHSTFASTVQTSRDSRVARRAEKLRIGKRAGDLLASGILEPQICR